ncbi:MAG: Mlc titration factor MtfA (ptsG expression regulator) [Bacteroidia bacterium]
MSIIAIIFLGALILLIIYVFLNSIYEKVEVLIDFYYGDKLHLRSLQKKPLEAQYKKAIANHFPYYKKLKPHKKDLFERKVQWFIDSREFVTGNDLDQLHPEMIALVSATAIQVTFGFPRVYLKHFKKVYIYNDAFQSPTTGRYHYGEVNGNGVIVLS